MQESVLLVAAFVITAALIPPLASAASRLGLIDHPGGRKIHQNPTPTVGGLAMGLAFLACFLAFRTVGTNALSISVVLVMIAGFIDDRYALGATPKFAFETVAAWLLAKYGGAMLVDLGELVGPQRLALGAIALPFTVFAVVGVMNAVNMSDGMDGCAAGLTIMATVWFTLAAAIAGRTVELEVASALLGLLLAFLLFNAHLPHRPSALVFMGDAGSYFIGLVLAWLAIRLAMGETPAFAPMTAVWILGIPLADAVVLLVRRPLRGRNPFRADNEHLHDLLRARGYSYGQIFSLLLAASFAMGAAGFGAERAGVPSYVMFYLYGVLWIAYYAYTSTFFSRRRRR